MTFGEWYLGREVLRMVEVSADKLRLSYRAVIVDVREEKKNWVVRWKGPDGDGEIVIGPGNFWVPVR